MKKNSDFYIEKLKIIEVSLIFTEIVELQREILMSGSQFLQAAYIPVHDS